MYRSDREKRDGSYPMVLRITINRTVKYYPLGIDIFPKDFDKKRSMVKRTDPLHHQKNTIITNTASKVAEVEKHFIRFDKSPTFSDFNHLYQSGSYNLDSLFGFIDYLIKIRKHDLASSTVDFYLKQKAKLQAFRSDVNLGEIDLHFIHAYKNYLIEKRNNNESTWNKSLEFVRRILNAALKEDRIQKNPFIHFPIKNVKGNIDYLTLEEVSKLDDHYKNCSMLPGQKNVLRYFLFACYTGMRFGDVQNLRFVNLHKQKETLWLYFTQQKTKKYTQIPLIPQAVALLPKKKFEQQKIFRVVPNQTTNRHLKEIVKELEINKRITFHSARHTCSNLLYRLDIPVEVRSLIVGDTVDVIRDRYTNTDQAMILKAMKKYSDQLPN